MSFLSRLSKAFGAFFNILSGNSLEGSQLTDTTSSEIDLTLTESSPSRHEQVEQSKNVSAVTQLLGALQREGRLVDFLMEDITHADDAAIGAAARVVHAGCKKVLDQYFELAPVWPGEEGSMVTVDSGFDPRRVEVIGGEHGLPITGTLAHGGWCIRAANLPTLTEAFLSDLIQKAEIER